MLNNNNQGPGTPEALHELILHTLKNAQGKILRLEQILKQVNDARPGTYTEEEIGDALNELGAQDRIMP